MKYKDSAQSFFPLPAVFIPGFFCSRDFPVNVFKKADPPGASQKVCSKLPLPNISLLAAMAIQKETWHRAVIAPAPLLCGPKRPTPRLRVLAGTEQLSVHRFIPVVTKDKTISAERPRLLSKSSQCLGHPQRRNF